MKWQPHRLTQAREEKGLSKTQLAQLVGVSRPAVSQWESDDGTEPVGKYLLKLAEVLDKPPSYFFGETPEPEPQPQDDPSANEVGLDRRLGDRLRQARDAVGLSQEAVANELGVERQAVGHWEAGRRVPSLKQLERLVRLYGVSADWLLGLVGDEARELPPQARDPRAIHLAAKRSYEAEFKEMQQRHEREFREILRRMREDFEAGKPSETGLLKD